MKKGETKEQRYKRTQKEKYGIVKHEYLIPEEYHPIWLKRAKRARDVRRKEVDKND